VEFGVEPEIKKAIKIHGADAVFTAAAAGVCEGYEPLKAMGLHVDTIGDAEQIGIAAYEELTAKGKGAYYLEASQYLYKYMSEHKAPEGLHTKKEGRAALVAAWMMLIEEQERQNE
jgi:hypothetical protein